MTIVLSLGKMVFLCNFWNVHVKQELQKFFHKPLRISIQRMILIYFFKVLSFSINAFVHSNKPVFETVFKIFFRQTVNGLF